MVFIRPKILRDGVQTAIETDAKYNYMRDEQQKARDRGEILPLLPVSTNPRAAADPAAAAAPDRARQQSRPAAPSPTSDAEAARPPKRRRLRQAMNEAARSAPRPARTQQRVGFAFAKRHGVLVQRSARRHRRVCLPRRRRAAGGRRSAPLSAACR